MSQNFGKRGLELRSELFCERGNETARTEKLKEKAIVPEIIPYNTNTRDKFDKDAQLVLDLLERQCDRVEIEPPNSRNPSLQWFVQVYRVRDQEIPEGFFGTTAFEAADRVASALGLVFEGSSSPEAALSLGLVQWPQRPF